MIINIENVDFDYELGLKVLKLKYKDNCPDYLQIKDIWDSVQEVSIKEIFNLKNIEARRVILKYLGNEKFLKKLSPELLSSVTLDKKVEWMINNKPVKKTIKDTYKLYKVKSETLSKNLKSYKTIPDSFYVEFKDTSTKRKYIIWVDYDSIINNEYFKNKDEKLIDAIDAIAWTIQTNIPKENIKSIIRQGDCILIEPFGKFNFLKEYRNLTKSEYLRYLKNES
jgi:hypothetical protein